jgi:hypothetical protein
VGHSAITRTTPELVGIGFRNYSKSNVKTVLPLTKMKLNLIDPTYQYSLCKP